MALILFMVPLSQDGAKLHDWGVMRHSKVAGALAEVDKLVTSTCARAGGHAKRSNCSDATHARVRGHASFVGLAFGDARLGGQKHAQA
jgi:hypothetical protein